MGNEESTGISEERFDKFVDGFNKFCQESARERGELRTMINSLLTQREACEDCSRLLAVHEQRIEGQTLAIAALQTDMGQVKESVSIHKVLFGILGVAVLTVWAWFSGLIRLKGS
jgi:hypothetical protein